MKLYDELVARGLIAQVTDEEKVREMIDNGKAVSALNAVFLVNHHIVAQIIEAELVVGAIGDIGIISRSSLLVIKPVDNKADTES